jgi:hypothetical protein
MNKLIILNAGNVKEDTYNGRKNWTAWCDVVWNDQKMAGYVKSYTNRLQIQKGEYVEGQNDVKDIKHASGQTKNGSMWNSWTLHVMPKENQGYKGFQKISLEQYSAARELAKKFTNDDLKSLLDMQNLKPEERLDHDLYKFHLETIVDHVEIPTVEQKLKDLGLVEQNEKSDDSDLPF